MEVGDGTYYFENRLDNFLEREVDKIDKKGEKQGVGKSLWGER